MDLLSYKKEKDKNVLRSMIDYMECEPEENGEHFDCGYTQKDIDKCSAILDTYIDGLVSCDGDNEKIMNCVKNVVKNLNKLNEETDFCLIETDQREDLCLFIQDAAECAGLPKENQDITEQWREW